MNIQALPVLLVFLTLCSCGHKPPVVFRPDSITTNMDATMNHTAGNILLHYYELKDGLVATDKGKAVQGAKLMKNAVLELKNQVATALSTGSYYAPVILPAPSATDSMLYQLDQILLVNADDCEAMRIHFKPLSDLMYHFLKRADAGHIVAYHHYCPMAMNEKGAYWLSTSPEIENPYFGQKMLTCGELVDTIK